jgi:DNA-binding IclR family transcriptional regulator
MSRLQTIDTDVGKSRLLGIGPAGVALLAAMSDSEVEEILVRRKEDYEQMGLKRRQIEKIVQKTRENGFSETHNSITFGVSGVGCAFSISPTVCVAVSIASENERMPPSRCKVIGELLLKESLDLRRMFVSRQRANAVH